MRICFIPYPVLSDSPLAASQKQLYPYLPLGILTLSTLLEQAGHEVMILDLVWGTHPSSLETRSLPDLDTVARLIQANAPDIVGFSTIFTSYPMVIRWAESFHNLSPETEILLGGPQATATDEETLKAFPWISMVLRGEAENSIVPLVTCLESKGDLASVPGLTWRFRNQIIRNRDANIISDLDTLPLPAYHLYPMERISQFYATRIGTYHNNFSLEAGRGCPFKCSFCSTSGFFRRRYRNKSVDRLIDEMDTLHTRYGLEHFDLSHDLFTCNPAYILEFCKKLRERGLHKKLKWQCYSRIDTVGENILAEMASAGCYGVFYGIETGSQRMQELIGKNLPINQVKPIVQETLSLGINVSASFICGFPQERLEDLSVTVALMMALRKMGVSQTVLLPLIPLVSSELYRTFGETLRYDGPSSEIFYGWLSQEDQNLILSWPRIFAGFYHYETPTLNTDVTRALLVVMNWYPHLLASLSTGNDNVMSVFERWSEWHHNHGLPVTEHYSPQKSFFSDFLRFLQEDLPDNQLTPHLNDIIRFHVISERVASAIGDAPIVSERFSCDVLALMRGLVNGRPLTNNECEPATYLFRKINGKVKSERLTPALSALLGMPQA